MAFNHSPQIVKDNLVLYLDAGSPKSYGGSGTTWTDISRNGNNGTLVNGVSASGGAMSFNGSTQYISGSNSNSFAFGTGDFTVSYWMNINSFSGAAVTPTFIDTRLTGNGAGYSDYIQSNKFKLFWAGADRYTSTSNISSGIWYNVAVTRQTNTVSVYINKILDGTFANSFNLTDNGLLIAKNINTVGASYLNGRIGSVLIYKDRGLSPAEILQNYNATKGRYGL